MTYTDPGPFISFGELKGARENSYLLFQAQRYKDCPEVARKENPRPLRRSGVWTVLFLATPTQ